MTTDPSLPKYGVAVAEHDAPAEQPEADRGDGEHDEVLRQNVDAVLRPAHARFDAGEAQVHEEHQHAGDHHPHGVGTDFELRRQCRHWIGGRFYCCRLGRLCRSRGRFLRRLLRRQLVGRRFPRPALPLLRTAVARAFLDRIQLVVPFVNSPNPEG